MEKFMFNAIAVIAFVGRSVANTSEIKILDAIAVIRDCMQEARAAEDATFAATGNYNASVAAGLNALAGCLEATGPTVKKSVSIN
jgi:hypothetical protein